MKKLKLPKFEPFEEAYDERCDIVQTSDSLCGFYARIDDDGGYLYGYISSSIYYDDAIVVTDDFTIKRRTKTNLKRTYNKVIKQLHARYKEWVMGLYIRD